MRRFSEAPAEYRRFLVSAVKVIPLWPYLLNVWVPPIRRAARR
ncbi:hypothetical protein Goari_019553 [Gossypium aridum]|uniref:Uncharacterized protein n=1 Tax=Gossypium aridum TaxID=34290 RepID=A0A7J8WTC8_GOSAI|nr:hypothetical protein [Gossypium aridum]